LVLNSSDYFSILATITKDKTPFKKENILRNKCFQPRKFFRSFRKTNPFVRSDFLSINEQFNRFTATLEEHIFYKHTKFPDQA